MSEAVSVERKDVSNTQTGILPPLAGLHKLLAADVFTSLCGVHEHRIQIRSYSCVCLCVANLKILTWKDSACPYFALIFGSRMVARLVPLTVNGVPPLYIKTQKRSQWQIDWRQCNGRKNRLRNWSWSYDLIGSNKIYRVICTAIAAIYHCVLDFFINTYPSNKHCRF